MKLIPAAAIFTTASLGFACGAGTSAYSITSGPPVCLIKTAFIVLLDRIAPLKNATRRSSLAIRFEPIGWFRAVRRSRWHLVLPQTGSREQRTGIGNSNDGCHDISFPTQTSCRTWSTRSSDAEPFHIGDRILRPEYERHIPDNTPRPRS